MRTPNPNPLYPYFIPGTWYLVGDDGRGSVEVSSGGEASNNSSGDEWEEEEEHGEGPNARRQGTPDHTSDAIDGDQVTRVFFFFFFFFLPRGARGNPCPNLFFKFSCTSSNPVRFFHLGRVCL